MCSRARGQSSEPSSVLGLCGCTAHGCFLLTTFVASYSTHEVPCDVKGGCEHGQIRKYHIVERRQPFPPESRWLLASSFSLSRKPLAITISRWFVETLRWLGLWEAEGSGWLSALLVLALFLTRGPGQAAPSLASQGLCHLHSSQPYSEA